MNTSELAEPQLTLTEQKSLRCTSSLVIRLIVVTRPAGSGSNRLAVLTCVRCQGGPRAVVSADILAVNDNSSFDLLRMSQQLVTHL